MVADTTVVVVVVGLLLLLLLRGPLRLQLLLMWFERVLFMRLEAVDRDPVLLMEPRSPEEEEEELEVDTREEDLTGVGLEILLVT